MNRTNRTRRAGFTLVEVIAATAILSVLTTSSFAIVRTAHNAWLRHRSDADQRREALVALQHIVRRVRQAVSVSSMSSSADPSGALTVQMADGTSAIWDHDGATNRMYYGTITANSLLAERITEFSVMGLTANGSGPAASAAVTHSVRCTVKYALTRPSGTITETVTGIAWIRAW